jgi:hypothetical protein
MNKEDLKDPEADPNCKNCHGWGRYQIGNICTGFGGKIESIDCICKLYKLYKTRINAIH